MKSADACRTKTRSSVLIVCRIRYGEHSSEKFSHAGRGTSHPRHDWLCDRVHRELGPGLPERFYRSAFCLELDAQGISYAAEHPVAVSYRGRPLGIQRLDLLVEERVVVELKAVERLGAVHRAQLLSYLRAARLRAGLLLNFNAVTLVIRRVVL